MDDSLSRLERTIIARRDGDPATSYVARLRAQGRGKMAQKLGEEAVETVIAALNGDKAELTGEAADLLFHLVVLLADCGVTLADVQAELDRREGVSGLDEKAARVVSEQVVSASREDSQTDEDRHYGRFARPIPLDQVGLPAQSDVTDALLAFLYRQAEWVKPAVAYEALAAYFGLSTQSLAETMKDGRNHWENRVQWARKELVDRSLLDNSRHGLWKLYK